MKYAYNINGGRYNYMHLKIVESGNYLRVRIRVGDSIKEIKIENFSEFMERTANIRCGIISSMVSDIVNEIDELVCKDTPYFWTLTMNSYLNDDALFYAVHQLVCDVCHIES